MRAVRGPSFASFVALSSLLLVHCGGGELDGSDELPPLKYGDGYAGAGATSGAGAGAGQGGKGGSSSTGPVGVGGSSPGGTGGKAGAPAKLTERHVAPHDTNPAIDGPHDHFTLLLDPPPEPPDPPQKAPGLFVHLAKTGGAPDDATGYLRMAARAGYHVVALSYPNAASVSALCDGDADAGCYEKVRLELLDGVDRTPKVTVSPADSIEGRLASLLAYLVSTYPTEGWTAYLAQGAVRWDKATLSGHSLGGGQAAIAAQAHTVARVILLAAPLDGQAGAPAPWLSAKSETPVPRFRTFVHESDGGYARIRAAWKAMGLDIGGQKRIETDAPPYGFSQELTTQIPPAAGGDPHDAVVLDAATPITDGGTPFFGDAWGYLIGPS